MAMTWRARDSHGHYLPSKDVHTTLGPEDWDDTCRHQPAAELHPSEDDFGHEPTWADFGQCVVDPGACNCPYHDEQQACARCRHGRQPVQWPCTSAIVLGLAPRTEAAA